MKFSSFLYIVFCYQIFLQDLAYDRNLCLCISSALSLFAIEIDFDWEKRSYIRYLLWVVGAFQPPLTLSLSLSFSHSLFWSKLLSISLSYTHTHTHTHTRTHSPIYIYIYIYSHWLRRVLVLCQRGFLIFLTSFSLSADSKQLYSVTSQVVLTLRFEGKKQEEPKKIKFKKKTMWA